MKRIIIVGATSGIGLEVAKCYINAGWQVGVAGRRESHLKEIQALCPERVVSEVIDVVDESAAEALNTIIGKLGGMDLFLLSSGIGKQNAGLNPEIEINTMMTNGTGFVRMMTAAFNYFKQQGGGHISAISSVAGTKGLGIAPSYSATKRFQNTYIDALAQLSKMEKLNIKFTDIRPGFVATELLKDLNYPLLMDAKYAGKIIFRALNKQKRIVIIDWRYRIIVFFWRQIPRFIWERLPVR